MLVCGGASFERGEDIEEGWLVDFLIFFLFSFFSFLSFILFFFFFFCEALDMLSGGCIAVLWRWLLIV